MKEQPPQPTPTPTTARHRIDSVHVPLGTPVDADPSDDIVLDETFFVLSYSADRRVPNWVSWRLARDDLGDFDRSDRFHADTLLPQGKVATVATFVMTNMQPQLHTLNAGPWKSLGTWERKLAGEQGKTLHVVAGGTFDATPARIASGVAVPKANYRITVVLDHASTNVTTTTPVYAVVMPNADEVKGHKWTEYMTSVDKVERATGYDFLSEVPDDVENVVEARVAAAA